MTKEWYEYGADESVPASAYVPWYEREAEEKVDDDYSAVRSGVVGFVETAIGAGDELDATIRLLVGEADNWSEAIGQSRSELAAFKEENPLMSGAITGAGLIGAFFIPGAGLAKISQGASKAARTAKAAGLGAAEGAAYGFLSGEDEERLTGAAIGAGAGGVLSGAAGRFLTKGADEITEQPLRKVVEREDKPVDIGGAEGFANRGRAASGTGDLDTNTHTRKSTSVVDDDAVPASIHDDPKKGSRLRGSLLLGTKEWVEKNVGIRAARLVEDSETMVRSEMHDIDVMFDDNFGFINKVFEDDTAFKSLFLRMNKTIDEPNRATFDMARRYAKTDDQKKAVDILELQSKVLRDLDFVPYERFDDYMPTINIAGTSGVTKVSDYDSPLQALKNMAKDVSAARAVARRFNLDMSKYEDEARKLIVENTKPMSRLEFVIKKVRDEARDQASRQGNVSDPSAVADNLRDALRSVLVSAKTGGDAVGAVARRGISAALLANPMNAILNFVEGFNSPVYQNGVLAWMQTVPKAVLATFNREFGAVEGRKWLSNKQLGLNNYMGEVQNAAKKTFEEGVETARYAKLPTAAASVVDKVGEAAYTLSGVRDVNRMSQEILTNSSIKRGMNLAKKGDEKSMQKLRDHPGMRGLSDSEFNKTVDALKEGKVSDPWVVNFAGASLNKWQPVSASAMPKAYNDNPNFRIMYSMLSYMNRQMNNLRTEVGLNILKVGDKGLNTKEGVQAAKAAMLNSAKYTALFGVVAGIWDDARKTLDFTNDKYIEDVLTPEGIASASFNQLASNISSGVINIRAQEYGGDPLSVTPAPLSAAAKLSTGVGKLLTEGDVDPLLRATQTYTPGVATIDRIVRMTPAIQDQLGRGRLFTD
mgnify:CR=1 FL=1|tara:strand:- start:321 stop:2945 length:2625 start_codon:yes stop_codon:yes gene_type:complete